MYAELTTPASQSRFAICHSSTGSLDEGMKTDRSTTIKAPVRGGRAQYHSQAASDVSVDSTASTMADAEMP